LPTSFRLPQSANISRLSISSDSWTTHARGTTRIRSATKTNTSRRFKHAMDATHDPTEAVNDRIQQSSFLLPC